MILHPAIENLIKSVNSNKDFNKNNLYKWCSPLPKEEKVFFTAKIEEDITRDEFISILQDMKSGYKPEGMIPIPAPSIPAIIPTPAPSIPAIYKKGDVLMHPVFKHPYVLLEKRQEYWLCCLITSEITCKEILEPCRSRFFTDSFITRVIFTTVDPVGRFIYPYENTRQLNIVCSKLKSLFK